MNKYKLEISGKYIKYFFNKLITNKINLYYINKSKDKIIIIIDEKDFDKILKIKSNCKIKILNRFGILKYKYLIYKYRYILLLFLIILFSYIILSNIIFKIEVIHEKNDIRELIINDLDTFGIRKYSFFVSYNKKENIKKKILKKEKEKIEWLEIERIGTKYIINVEEKKIKKEIYNNDPQDVIAKKDAMITSISSTSGEIVKKKYDYVKKGDLLISGTIHNKKREVKKLKAEGKVFGEVWYKVTVEIPVLYEEKNLTGKTKKTISLIFLNNEYSLELKKYKNYSFKEVKLFKNNLLPIKLVIRNKKEEIIKKYNYNINNIDKKALLVAKEKLNNKRIIKEKVLKKTLNKSTIVVDMFFKVEEDITAYQKITDLELKEDTDE